MLGVDDLLVMGQSDVLDDVVGWKPIGANRLARSNILLQDRPDCIAFDGFEHFHSCERDGFVSA